MAISAGMALMSTATVALTGGTFIMGTMFSHFLVTTAMGAALNALTPKPDTSLGQANRGYQVTQRGAAADQQIIYGQTRVGGVVIYDATTGTDNKYLHRVVVFAGHEIEEFTTFYLNDEAVTIDGSGNVTSPSNYSGYVRINSHLGTAAQAADSDLVSEVGEWTGNHKLSGIAYAYFRFKYNEDAFPNGLPDISAVIKGKKVYDPRTATTVWSDNPALCIRDYLSSDYGLNEPSARIDDTLVSTAADVCDWINYPTNTVGPRFTLNGAFLTSSTPHDNLMSLLTSMGGMLWYSQGQWRMKPAYYTSPVLRLDEDDLRSAISVSTRHSRRDNFNTVKGTFRGPDTNYQPTDYAEVTNITSDGLFTAGQPYVITELGTSDWNVIAGTTGVTYSVGDLIIADTVGSGGNGKANYWLGVDNGQESVVDLNLSFSDDFDVCRRIARIYLERNRQQLTVQASFGLRAFQCQVGDIIQLSNTRFGWILKEFEVVNWNFGLQEGLDLQVNLTLREVSANVFNEVDDGAVLELDNTTLDSPFDVQVPSLDAAVVSTQVNNDGTTVPIITFSWGVTNPELVQYYEFQWKITGDTTYNTRLVREGEYTLAPAISNASYDYRVRAVNHLSVKSQWINAASPASTGNDSTTPSAPTGLSVVAGYGSATVTWTAPTTNTDASTLKDLFQYKVYRGTSANPTTLVGRVSGEIFTDSGLVDETEYFYRVKAVDFTGNESAYSNESSATTNPQLQDGVDGADGATGADGARGAGRWNIGVTTLPTTSSGADTDFTNAIGDPVDLDQAWFYTGTQANPTSQSVWIYDAGTDTWNEQEEVIDGDLVVSGTITAAKIQANTITGDKLATTSIITSSAQIDNLIVNTAQIANGAITNRFAAFTGANLTPTTSYQLLQEVTIDCDGNPISVLFNAGINGATSVDIDIRLDGVSQRTFRTSSGYYTDASGWGINIVDSFVFSVPSTHGHSGNITSTVQYFEIMSTVAMTLTPASGSRTVSVYGKINGGFSSSPVIRNRYLETTELKK